ncbi:hypothetical protein Tco_1296704 [Tanacetum coccineum]
MNGCCADEPVTCSRLGPRLLTIEGPTPGRPVGLVPNWGLRRRPRSAVTLCLPLSSCSPSFINRLSTSANCFSFNSNLFNCRKQNVAFVSSENTSSTNEAVNTAHEVSTASSQGQASSSTYADDVMFSFFVNQSNSPQLDNEDVEHIDTDDLEEIYLKWQVAMLTMRVKRFLKMTGSVSLNLLSRTRKFGHSTMELRSLIS